MKTLSLIFAFMLTVSAFAEETDSVAAAVAAAEAAYTRTITQRAEKIVATLNIADTNKATRVRDIITQQYRNLAEYHKMRAEYDADVKALKAQAKTNSAYAGTVILDGVREPTENWRLALRYNFLQKLAVELTPSQVEQVKDGMTYGVLPLTYGVYLKMYPDLTDEQKAQIKAWLTEAREIAMEGGTSEEKHAVFGKYKGKINNYLSKAGYDAKKAEQNLKKPAAPGSDAKAK